MTPQSTATTALVDSILSAKALAAAKKAAQQDVLNMQTAYQRRSIYKINTWDDLANFCKVAIPTAFRQRPFTYAEVSTFCHVWTLSAAKRAERSAVPPPKVELLKPEQGERRLSATCTLKPEQVVAVDRIIDKFANGYTRILQDGLGGCGKTFIAAGVIHHWLVATEKWKLNSPIDMMPFRVVVITRKTVIPQYRAVLVAAGLGPYLTTRQLIVTSYNQLSSSFGEQFMMTRYDASVDNYVTTPNPLFRPTLVILDECHACNDPRTQQTQFIRNWQKCEPPVRFVHMSATPFVTVNHSFTFVADSGYVDPVIGLVTAQNFDGWAATICKKPHKANKEAAKRLRSLLADRIVSLPRVKWPSKAINQILVVDFASDKDKAAYDRAFADYLDAKRRLGENTSFGGLDHLVALGQFRKAAEPLRVPALVDLMLRYHRAGRAPVVGCCFRETVAALLYQLVYKQGIPRHKIAVIWGGKRAVRKDLLLNDEQLAELMARAAADPTSLDDDERRALKESVTQLTERARLNETPEEQTERQRIMEELGLVGVQSAAARQEEIDRLQSGEAEYGIFTLAAGGVGLSLDQDKPTLRPRVGFLTPSYSGPEFQQALFRLIRRCTLTDVEQFLVYLRGTVEETHVAPKVDANLKCLAAITGAQFSLLDFDTAPKTVHKKFRTAEEAAADADDEANRVENLALDTEEDDDDDND